MNGYSKIRQPFSSNKSRSMDLSSDSDAFSFSHPNKTNNANNGNTQSQKSMEFDYSPDHAESGKGFSSSGGLRFSRQRSGRSERLSSTVENAVKKVVSMRRSSSVSERYCKMIYDVDDGLLVDDDDGNVEIYTTTSASTKKKLNKKGNGVGLFKACKRLFGF